MPRGLSRTLPHLLTSGGHLLLLLLAWQIGGRMVWLVSLGLIVIFSGLAWLYAARRYRAIADTPTSRIGSAAQGFVELMGVGQALPDRVVYTPSTQLPCLWYRYKAYRVEGNKRELVEQGESDEDFVLDDGSGRCLLRPHDAEMYLDRKDVHARDGYRYEEEIIVAGERLYALGRFHSHDGRHVHFDARAELDGVLTAWKADQAGLKQRFDLDRNGAIDPDEWALALQAARREVGHRQAETDAALIDHSLEKPGHGRPYLISNTPPERLARRYRHWSWMHGAIVLCAIGAWAYWVGRPV